MPDPEPTPTPTPTPTPEPTPTPTPNPTPRDPVGDPTPNDFTVPEQYLNIEREDGTKSDAGWVGKVKSLEDVYKQLDSLDTLVGKKEVPFDYEKATPQEVEEHASKTRPEKKEDYDFFGDDTPEENRGVLQDMFYDLGVSKHVAQKLTENFSAIQKGIMEPKFSKEGFTSVLKSSFPDNTDKVAGETANFIKNNVNEEDAKAIEAFDNDQLGLVYRLANTLMKQYGATESDKGLLKKDGSGSFANVDEMRKSIRAEIKGLARRPHSQEEKNKLDAKLNATYK